MDPDDQMVPRPTTGRTYSMERRVRLGDVGPKGRARLDAIARYLQDVSNDDAVDAALEGAMAWVVRRTRVEVEQFPTFREDLRLTTWCSGIGARWAARRVDVEGSAGARVRAEALWVHVDLDRGTPRKLPDAFHDTFAESAGGRAVRARLHHDGPPGDPDERLRWPLRFTDLDLMGHVNNAISWSMVEEVLAGRPDLRGAPLQAEVEHPGPVDPGAVVDLLVRGRDDAVDLWATADGTLATTARVRRA